MKQTIKLIFIGTVLLLFGCKDSLEQDGRGLGMVPIIKMANGELLQNRVFYYSLFDTVRIEAFIDIENGSSLPNSLSYFWTVSGDTLGRQKDFSYEVSKLPTGISDCRLVIKDVTRDVVYTSDFKIYALAGVKEGSFILSSDEKKCTQIEVFGYKSVDDDKVIRYRNFAGLALGREPINLHLSYLNTENKAKNFITMRVVSKFGDYPIIDVDYKSLNIQSLYAKYTAVITGEPLVPTYSWSSSDKFLNGNLYNIILIDGQAHMVTNGVVSGNIYEQDKYNFGKSGLIVFENNSTPIVGFEKGLGFRVFEEIYFNTVNGFPNQVFLRFDSLYFKDREFVALAGENDYSDVEVITRDQDSFSVVKSNDAILSPYKAEPVNIIDPFGIMRRSVHFLYRQGSWFFAIDRSLYRLSSKNGVFETFLTLPNDDSGDIVTWNFSHDLDDKIGIATFNPNAKTDRKGSYYLYNLKGNVLEKKYLYQLNRATKIEFAISNESNGE